MGKMSTKEKKSIYQITREKLGLSREQAADEASKLNYVLEPSKLERIENYKQDPSPYDIVVMATIYKEPQLCYYFCSNECAIGKNRRISEITMKELSEVVVNMLSSLNSVQKKKDTLIDIAADGVVENTELEDFIEIQKNLKRVAETYEALRLWTEKMLADGKIDAQQYKKLINKN